MPIATMEGDIEVGLNRGNWAYQLNDIMLIILNGLGFEVTHSVVPCNINDTYKAWASRTPNPH